jgi:uncharacterized membrane protein YfcA
MFATVVVLLGCALIGAVVGIALNSNAVLLSGSAVGLLLGVVVAREVWRMPVRRTSASRRPVSHHRRRRRH